VKHGGTLVPKYDPAIVTHIVTDTTARPTLRALSLKLLSEIPNHIPTVTWNWVISGYGRANKGKGRTAENVNDKGKAKATDRDMNDEGDDESGALDFEFLHAAFAERIDAGRSWQRIPAPQENQDEILDYSIKATSANLAYDGNDDVSRISYVPYSRRRGDVGAHSPQLFHARE
jgi:DNA polymerase lambda